MQDKPDKFASNTVVKHTTDDIHGDKTKISQHRDDDAASKFEATLDDLDDHCGPWCKHNDYGFTDHPCGVDQYDASKTYRISRDSWDGKGLAPPPRFVNLWNGDNNEPP